MASVSGRQSRCFPKVAGDTGLEVVILRPPLIYGPGVKANFLSLFKIVDRGIPLPLASPSLQVMAKNRNYIRVTLYISISYK